MELGATRRQGSEEVRPVPQGNEVRAHATATGDLQKGLLYATEAGHLTTRVVAEGTVAGIGVAGGAYVAVKSVSGGDDR